MPRWVFDTDVMVAAFRSETGASRRLLVSVLRGQIDLLVSVPLMVEYEAVLTRSEHVRNVPGGIELAGSILDALSAVLVPVQRHYLWRPNLDDANDDMVLETAANGRADALVTFNVRHFERAAERFDVRVIRPGEAWLEVNEHAKK